jgi:hypothetical protein
MNIKFNGDGAFTDLEDKMDHVISIQTPIEVVVLDKGMVSGKPSIAMRIELPDGRTVIAETSGRLFALAGKAVLARYPDLFED